MQILWGGGGKADLLITDPPYNVDYEGTAGKIKNDNMADNEFHNFLVDVYLVIKENVKKGGAFYIWHADGVSEFRTASLEAGLRIRQVLIWVKNSFVMSRQDYHWQHESCLYGWIDGASHFFIDDRKQSTVFEDKGYDFKKMKKAEMLELLEQVFSDKISTTIIHENKPSRSEDHPTMKPVKLIARQIKNSSKQGEIVLDLFGGSGTTLIASEQTRRVCRMVELDPHYCDVIRRRWTKWATANNREVGSGGLY